MRRKARFSIEAALLGDMGLLEQHGDDDDEEDPLCYMCIYQNHTKIHISGNIYTSETAANPHSQEHRRTIIAKNASHGKVYTFDSLSEQS